MRSFSIIIAKPDCLWWSTEHCKIAKIGENTLSTFCRKLNNFFKVFCSYKINVLRVLNNSKYNSFSCSRNKFTRVSQSRSSPKIPMIKQTANWGQLCLKLINLIHDVSVYMYRLSGCFCSDNNECTSGASNCATNAACINTPGSFTCVCNAGYSGTGVTCSGS